MSNYDFEAIIETETDNDDTETHISRDGNLSDEELLMVLLYPEED